MRLHLASRLVLAFSIGIVSGHLQERPVDPLCGIDSPEVVRGEAGSPVFLDAWVDEGMESRARAVPSDAAEILALYDDMGKLAAIRVVPRAAGRVRVDLLCFKHEGDDGHVWDLDFVTVDSAGPKPPPVDPPPGPVVDPLGIRPWVQATLSANPSLPRSDRVLIASGYREALAGSAQDAEPNDILRVAGLAVKSKLGPSSYPLWREAFLVPMVKMIETLYVDGKIAQDSDSIRLLLSTVADALEKAP